MQRLLPRNQNSVAWVSLLLAFWGRSVAFEISEQYNALTTLYTALNGSAWVSNTGWGDALSTSGEANYCTWTGVYCCGASSCTVLPADAPVVSCTPCGAVVGLSLDNNNLVGQIEDSSGAIWDVMESLEFINLQGDCF